jgi:hypothetical protein
MTIGLVAYFLVVSALFPQHILKTRNTIQSMSARSFGIGLVNFVFFTVIALVLFSVSENATAAFKVILTIPALIILAVLAILLSFGLAGMSNLIGERIFQGISIWKQTLWGTGPLFVVLCLCWLVPVLPMWLRRYRHAVI